MLGGQRMETVGVPFVATTKTFYLEREGLIEGREQCKSTVRFLATYT